jgi:anti-anti-sigma factor
MLELGHADWEIDTASAPAFNAHLHDTIDNSDQELVVVDCSDITFMDSAAFHVLVNATEYAVRRGHVLVVRNMSPFCAMLLRLCDSDRELHLEL